MIVIGLTGSVAMGKSHAASMFLAYGVPVFDSDAAVHALLRPRGAAVAPVAAAFPEVVAADGGIDRPALGRRVFGDDAALKRLEAIVHPLVRAAQRRFLQAACRAGLAVVVLDVPLLYEGGGDALVDCVAVTSASPLLQRQRALRRGGMSEARLAAILAKQTPDPDKRRRAEFVIPSGHDRGLTADAVAWVLRSARQRQPRAWPAAWLRRSTPSDGIRKRA